MKSRNRLISALCLLGLAMLVLSSAQAKDEPAELKGEEVKIIDIIQDAAGFEGQNVVIEGVIETECPSGCWFIVNDDTGSIYVDILPSNFVIPQKRGEDAKVYGEVVIKDGDPMIIGKMVRISGEIYQ
jgi:opacity protein-like surface antigen